MTTGSMELGRGRRLLNTVLRFVWFGRVTVIGAPTIEAPPIEAPGIAVDGSSTRPRLVLVSHRNGAIDGHQVLVAFPRAQFLISIQLVRNWFMRLFFAGIPVVRPKDVERYGLDPSSVASPVEAACAHLRAGGELGIFPEASSQWGFRPQPYKSGAARIACALIDEGVDLEVVPLGLFYSNPDRFRSRAEVVRGRPITIPARGSRDRGVWESDVAARFAEALDAVSVDCPDQEAFDRVQSESLHEVRTESDASFAEVFLRKQRALSQRPATEVEIGATASSPSSSGSGSGPTVVRVVGLALMWLFAPVLGAGAFAGSRADGRNTVTFFSMLGGGAAAMVWIPVIIVAAWFWPLLIGIGLISAVIGWIILGLRRWRL